MLIMYYTLSRNHCDPALWEGQPTTPVMVPASTCYAERVCVPSGIRVRPTAPQCRPLACDSGGFLEKLLHGEYRFTRDEYVAWLRGMRPDWAAVMDYPCEIELAADEKAVARRQRWTLDNARALLKAQESWEWLPVLQGRTVGQYITHARMYGAAGLVRPYMGIGSLCRRTSVHEIAAIAQAMTEELPGVRFHLFGVKSAIFKRPVALPASVASADTAAWNGMFFKGRAEWQRYRDLGWKQAQYEVRVALPRYRAGIERATAQPKQLAFA